MPVGGGGVESKVVGSSDISTTTSENDASAAAIDAQVGLLIKQQMLRIIANYQFVNLKNYGPTDIKGNKVQIAVQAQLF